METWATVTRTVMMLLAVNLAVSLAADRSVEMAERLETVVVAKMKQPRGLVAANAEQQQRSRRCRWQYSTTVAVILAAEAAHPVAATAATMAEAALECMSS